MNTNNQNQNVNVNGNGNKFKINQESKATINQDSNNVTSQKLTIDKILIELGKLEELINNETSLESEVKDEALEKIKHLKQASQNPEDEQMKGQAKSAWRYLKTIPVMLKNLNENAEQIKKLLPYIDIIKTFFGF
ncbi:hypothetical protein [Aphanothece sacrum]|uniref:Secreted effector protein PipB n=1 Tax=Aphanothece sacrum FPU1 TaxID=1920663 RepID=A0A401IN83_APHSA|nr:hypothetical protein [Aphanothece sacrum]GBF82709.1 secreted effector protein PipB [Aphanothece sacrum FPU1]GBF84500.1 secreted effector protein PipB [Aphanothece sacrum FPU3]